MVQTCNWSKFSFFWLHVSYTFAEFVWDTVRLTDECIKYCSYGFMQRRQPFKPEVVYFVYSSGFPIFQFSYRFCQCILAEMFSESMMFMLFVLFSIFCIQDGVIECCSSLSDQYSSNAVIRVVVSLVGALLEEKLRVGVEKLIV